MSDAHYCKHVSNSFFSFLFTAVNSELRLLTATDGDDGQNGQVKYSLLQTVLEQSKNLFEVDSDSGMVTLKKQLDREEIAEHVLYIKAQDSNRDPTLRLIGKWWYASVEEMVKICSQQKNIE